MSRIIEIWRFIAERLQRNEAVILLVVAESSGSSPGRQGYKMAVGGDGELFGSIGGGVMEVNLVEQSREILAVSSVGSEPPAGAGGYSAAFITPQVHQKHAAHASGMICSGKQTVIFKLLSQLNAQAVQRILEAMLTAEQVSLTITPEAFRVGPSAEGHRIAFERTSETDFRYSEPLGAQNRLYIVGGGHCALALSELMSKMAFHITIFDDRPDLNTIEKNEFADEIRIIEGYEDIADHIGTPRDAYVAVMTLGYSSDKVVIEKLLDKEFKYFGVLGSRAKMATLMKELKEQGFDAVKLARIHTPIGIPINSRTPEEIAVSIAAEIISVKNT